MNAQEWIVAAIGALTVGYLVWRSVRRRLAGTCCGERECPAASAVARRLAEHRES
ncbi:MAG: hypothetical protein QNJ90_09760 [Planctomycetota bacterium]|nr:hypothetical protein [Planctomycetota bacterium]